MACFAACVYWKLARKQFHATQKSFGFGRSRGTVFTASLAASTMQAFFKFDKWNWIFATHSKWMAWQVAFCTTTEYLFGTRYGSINFINFAAHYVKILQEMDHNLLLHLALGNKCYVYDFASRKTDPEQQFFGQSRIIWQGLPFIRFALNRIWYDLFTEFDTKEYHWAKNTYARELRNISPATLTRLQYYRRYTRALLSQDTECHTYNPIQLYGISQVTSMDGKKEFYSQVLWDTFVVDNVVAGGSVDDDNNARGAAKV